MSSTLPGPALCPLCPMVTAALSKVPSLPIPKPSPENETEEGCLEGMCKGLRTKLLLGQNRHLRC